MSEADRRKALEDIARQRWIEAEGGEKKYVIGTSETVSADSPVVAKEFYDYYRTPRGHHPRSTRAMSLTSNGALMQFYPFEHVDTIPRRPILLIAGEVANSRYFSEDAFRRAAEPKELTRATEGRPQQISPVSPKMRDVLHLMPLCHMKPLVHVLKSEAR